MPYLMAVETGSSIVVVSGDLAGIVLRGFHGVLVPELCVRDLGPVIWDWVLYCIGA